jgi:hypothetical protein
VNTPTNRRSDATTADQIRHAQGQGVTDAEAVELLRSIFVSRMPNHNEVRRITGAGAGRAAKILAELSKPTGTQVPRPSRTQTFASGSGSGSNPDAVMAYLARIAHAVEALAGIEPESLDEDPTPEASPRRALTSDDARLLPLVRLVAAELVKAHGALPGEHKIRAALAAVGIRVGTQRAGDLARAAIKETNS